MLISIFHMRSCRPKDVKVHARGPKDCMYEVELELSDYRCDVFDQPSTCAASQSALHMVMEKGVRVEWTQADQEAG